MSGRPRRTIDGVSVVEGLKLRWSVSREPLWSTADGYKGLAILVKLAEGSGRELLLEYPFPAKKPNGIAHLPERPKILPKMVEADIRLAMEAGWNPQARGKTFAFQISK
jgi:hypothetical protein